MFSKAAKIRGFPGITITVAVKTRKSYKNSQKSFPTWKPMFNFLSHFTEKRLFLSEDMLFFSKIYSVSFFIIEFFGCSIQYFLQMCEKTSINDFVILLNVDLNNLKYLSSFSKSFFSKTSDLITVIQSSFESIQCAEHSRDSKALFHTFQWSFVTRVKFEKNWFLNGVIFGDYRYISVRYLDSL